MQLLGSSQAVKKNSFTHNRITNKEHQCCEEWDRSHQIAVVLCFIQTAGIWEEQHLRVRVDGEVKLNRVLVTAQEVSHGLRLRLGLGEGPAVDLRAGVVRGSLGWRQHSSSYKQKTARVLNM